MATNNLVNFKQGLLAALPSAIANGTLYFTTDEGAIYLDTNNERVRFGDIVTVANVASLPSGGHAYETALYYAKTENVLARWDKDSNKWIQLNAAGLVSVNAATGDGNVITSLSVDAAGKVTPVKGFTAASASEVNALKNQVGTGTVDSRIEAARAALQSNIDTVSTRAEKGITDAAAAQDTADEAKSAASTNATNISNNTSAINTLKGQVGTGTVDSRIASAKAELEEDIEAVSTRAEKGIADAAAAQSTANAANSQANTNKANIATLTTDVAGLKTADSQLDARIDVLEAAVGDNGSVDEKIAALRKEILTDGTANDAISDAYDTIQEIAGWLGENELGKTAGEIIADINTNASAINTLKGQVGTGTVDSRIAAAKEELEEDIDAVSTRAEKGITDAAAAQTTANEAKSAAATNATNIATNTSAINSLKTQVGTGTVDSRIEAARAALQSNIDTVSTRAEKGITDAAAAQTTANQAKSAASTNATNISNNATAINTNKTNITTLTNALTWGSF